MTCALLRQNGVPARARGGFETYFSPHGHHDHWICEYWHNDDRRWVQVDAGIGNTRFDNCDLPPGTFMTGSETWLQCRAGTLDPNLFGIGGPDDWTSGWPFVLNELVLDLMALNKYELLPWDSNRLSEIAVEDLSGEQLAMLDQMARLAVSGDSTFLAMRTMYEATRALHMPEGWQP